jgi:hypothetical protein
MLHYTRSDSKSAAGADPALGWLLSEDFFNSLVDKTILLLLKYMKVIYSVIPVKDNLFHEEGHVSFGFLSYVSLEVLCIIRELSIIICHFPSVSRKQTKFSSCSHNILIFNFYFNQQSECYGC